MKYFKKYYAHVFILGFVLFALTGAYYSTPMILNFEYEFKATISGEDPEPLKPISPPDKSIRNI